jgi:capsular polysaccharide biosynthesis protein
LTIGVARSLDSVPSAATRAALVWRARYWIALGAIAATALTYVVSKAVPATYRSSSEILVATIQPSGITKTAVDAGNDLASQYEQLLSTTSVLSPAASSLRISYSTLQSSVSAGTIGAQNLVSVSAVGPSPVAAQARANAVATQFVKQQQTLSRLLIAKYLTLANNGNPVLVREVSAARAQLRSSSPAVRAAAATELPLLLGERAKEAATIIESGYISRPSLSLYSSAGLGVEVLPKPTLFAVLALLISLVVGAQIAAVIGFSRRMRDEEPTT